MTSNGTNLDSFTLAYAECALWSSTDDQGEALDRRYSVSDIAPDTLARMVEDCQDFRSYVHDLDPALSDLLDSEPALAGNDYWLTRNRHGAGYWDRAYWGAAGRQLTEAAHTFGSVDLYVGDDGLIHANP
jgi:hypothetical protein